MIRLSVAGAVTVLWALSLPALAGEVPNDIPARTELYAIPSLTLSDSQFLKGDAAATAVTVTGVLRLSPNRGKQPVVVLMHGSGGMGANIPMWARLFNTMGVATFAIDGFTGRGIKQTSTNQALLGRLNFILDIYRSLDILAKHPLVDRDRIALMGFSRGGQAALYASLKRFHRMWNKSGVEFAAYVPFYPDCATTFIADTDVADRPIRIFGGTVDDYNPITLCKVYAARLKAAGHDVTVTEYPHANHGFDNPLSTKIVGLLKSQSVRNCKIVEEPQGLLINASTKQPFNYKDPCVANGPHIGADREAAAQAKQAVTGFLRTVFKLK
jgi:dienelactone hydrolase